MLYKILYAFTKYNILGGYIMSSRIKITKSIKEIKDDILTTKDPLRKALLVEFLRIKISEVKNTASTLDTILKEQDTSIEELKKITDNIAVCKNNAYKELLEENLNQSNVATLETKRGKIENKWEYSTQQDAKYTKYIESDHLNNKLMERLNSEIEFVLDDTQKQEFCLPFDDDEMLNKKF